MKRTPCLYSIIRFCPFVETGEFANVGVVVIAPEARFFNFRLLINRHARVTHFFEQLDAKVFRMTMRNVRDELERVKAVLMQNGFDRRYKANDVVGARFLFDELIRPRETVVKFSEQRGMLAADPATALEELFEFYVGRNFVTKQYQEQVLDRGMRQLLNSARIADRFMQLQIGDEEYHATFPFVEQRDEVPVKVIKPLHLAHDQPSKILDHGGQWLFRIEQLKKRLLLPDQVLFAVDSPKERNTPRANAAADIVEGLVAKGVDVVPVSDKQAVMEFVRH
jgi:hypothetical protein